MPDRARAAPRRFSPRLPYAYVVNELASTITSYRFDAAPRTTAAGVRRVNIADHFHGLQYHSEIVVSPSGRFVYASNRGMTALRFLHRGRRCCNHLRGLEPTQGKTPRFFGLDPSGSLLCVANQDSDTIVLFSMSPETVRCGQPVGLWRREVRQASHLLDSVVAENMTIWSRSRA